MQKNLPAPAVKESKRVVAKSNVKPSTLRPLGEFIREDLTEPVQNDPNEETKMQLKSLGFDGSVNVSFDQDDIIISLPTFDLFGKGEYEIDSKSTEVHRVTRKYTQIAQAIAKLVEYDISFIGHTDETPISYHVLATSDGSLSSLKNNMELGFLRAISLYHFFFKEYLMDETRITFSSRGDVAPLVLDAKYDSETRKNRRVDILLRKRSS
jgi:flagellar motor protein MotB